jgi:hypothetical protein
MRSGIVRIRAADERRLKKRRSDAATVGVENRLDGARVSLESR